VLRWLLPLFAAIALMGSIVMAWAAAGFIGEAACCCPDKATCKCHDHGKDTQHDTELNKCTGKADFAPPEVVSAVQPAVDPIAVIVRTNDVATPAVDPIPEPRTIEIETPPF
jgi:hypothetical protein